MRRFARILVITLAVLVAAAATAWLVAGWLARRDAEENLARQAAEIAAHREAQRAAAPAELAAPPPVSSSTETVEPAPETVSGAPVEEATATPAIAWTTSWTGFRGAQRDGHYTATPIRTDWTSIEPLWKQPIGGGYASLVTAGGRAFTIEQRGTDEVAVAYDVLTGRELWSNAWKAMFFESMGGPGPRATPAVDGDTVYTLGATGELRALDVSTGALRWRTNILEDADASNLYWGMAASPLIVDDTVIVVPGGGSGRSIVAYDRATGRVAWSALDDEAAYSSPVRATLAGADQIVLFLANRLIAISPDRGALLWEYPWPSQGGNHAAQPVIIGDDRVFASAAGGGALIQVAREGSRLVAREAWQTNRMKNDLSSSVHHDGFIYGLDAGILACIDAATGDLKWKAGRYGNGQTLLASEHLVVTTEDGDVLLVRATPDGHQVAGRFAAVEGRTWNHPAIADGILLVRNGAEMAAFDLRAR